MKSIDPSAQSVHLVRHNPLWRVMFWIEKAQLTLILGGKVLGIEHVGSTAIPGMPAKPIIDISLAVTDYEQAWGLVAVLQSIGYDYLGENETRREYSFEKSHPYAYGLFICEKSGDKWQNRLSFRDYLRAHLQARQAYADLKKQLANEHKDDLLAYQSLKLPFVQKILYTMDDV